MNALFSYLALLLPWQKLDHLVLQVSQYTNCSVLYVSDGEGESHH